MIPPTPTAFPTPVPGSMPFAPPDIGVWSYTDDVLQVWFSFTPTWTLIVQAIILLALVGAGLYMLVAFIRRMVNEGEVSGD